MKPALLGPVALALLACTRTTLHGIAAGPESTSSEGVVLNSRGREALFVDPKDAGVSNALALLEESGDGVPSDLFEGVSAPLGAVRTIVELLVAGATFRAGTSLGFYAQLEVDGEARGQRLLTRLESLGVVEPAGADHTAPAGLEPIRAAGHPGWHGIFRDRWVLAVGDLVREPIDIHLTDLPINGEPALLMRLDSGQAGELYEELAPLVGEQPIDLATLALGLVPAPVEGGVGFGSDRAYACLQRQDYVRAARSAGVMPGTPLRLSTLRLVPGDAVVAHVGAFGLPGLPGVTRKQLAEAGWTRERGDPFEAASSLAGVDVVGDVFAHLGQAWGFYLSDATGGGGWASAILFFEVADAEELGAALDVATERLGALALATSEGRARLVRGEAGSFRLTTLTFPGMPMPVELTWALSNRYLFIGLSPQAVASALEQSRGTGACLLDNPSFRETAGKSLEGVYSIAYVDTPRLARRGYGALSLACSTLANVVTSPEATREGAASLLPPFQEFATGVRPMVSVTHIVGDDMVTTVQADRSVMVNVAAILALVADWPAFAGTAVERVWQALR